MAARGEWTFKSYEDANHQPVVSVAHKNIVAPAGHRVRLREGRAIPMATRSTTPCETIHMIFEVRDSGELPLTRYQRVIVTVGRSRTGKSVGQCP
jgi:hypothetical protein